MLKIPSRRILLSELHHSREEPTVYFKKVYQTYWQQIEEDFWQQRQGLETAAHITALTDKIIRSLAETIAEKHPAALGGAIIALGSYGRSQLAPYSDIDLLFLYSDHKQEQMGAFVENMVRVLWDIGLKVGYAARTPSEMIDDGVADHRAATAMLDARFLWGEPALHASAWQEFYSHVIEKRHAFIAAKRQEMNERHAKADGNQYFVEPNIKEAKGSLRDIQAVWWIGNALQPMANFEDFYRHGYLTETDAKQLTKALAYLLTVRCAMHYVQGKPVEKLGFGIQPMIAEKLLYKNRHSLKAVERFLKQYHLTTRHITAATHYFLATVEAHLQQEQPILRAWSDNKTGNLLATEGFVLENGLLTFAEKQGKQNKPRYFMRLFTIANQIQAEVHPQALEHIRANLSYISDKVRADPLINNDFITVLTAPKNPHGLLRQMADCGLLAAFVPDFAPIVGLMQYDMYHIYTVEEHTLQALNVLHRVKAGEMASILPLASKVVQQVQSWRVLVVAVLLHDIAKGRGGDHSLLGAEVALQLCPRFGLTIEETETVAWLVQQHLLMTFYAFKRDINDADTLEKFVDTVQSVEQLRLLLVLTAVDIFATNPGLFNSWKGALLRDLFYAAEDQLSGGLLATDRKRQARASETAVVLRQAGIAEATIPYWQEVVPQEYWLAMPREAQKEQLALLPVAAMTEGREPVFHTFAKPHRGIIDITICVADRAGLFSQIVGAITVGRANINDARIFTLGNGLALDTFAVQAQDKTMLWEDQVTRLIGKIRAALKGEANIAQQLAKQQHIHSPPEQQIIPRVVFDNTTSSLNTIIEITAADRAGLLYAIATIFHQQKIKINRAKISTFGARAVDIFYVRDAFGLKITSAKRLEKLQEDIKKIAVL